MDLLRCSRSFALMKLITHGVAAYKLVNELVFSLFDYSTEVNGSANRAVFPEDK